MTAIRPYLHQKSLQSPPPVHCNHYLAHQQTLTQWPWTAKGICLNLLVTSTLCDHELTPTQKAWPPPQQPSQGQGSIWSCLFCPPGLLFIHSELDHAPQLAVQSQQSSAPSSPEAFKSTVKAEDLNSLIAKFTKLIIEVIHSTQPCNQPCSSHSHDGKIECNYCGKEHFIHDCPHVATNIQAGKCRRNQDGKVVLPTGAFVPQDIVGRYLHDHIDEWHKHHLNQLAAGTLIHIIDKWIVEEKKSPSQFIYQLTTTNCIAVLEAELFNLRARKQLPAHANCTHAQNLGTPIRDWWQRSGCSSKSYHQQELKRLQTKKTCNCTRNLPSLFPHHWFLPRLPILTNVHSDKQKMQCTPLWPPRMWGHKISQLLQLQIFVMISLYSCSVLSKITISTRV